MAIKFKGSEVSGAVPTGLGERELAFNLSDLKIFSADSQGNLIEFDGTGKDEKVKKNSSDPTPGFLEDKLGDGDGIYFTNDNDVTTGDILTINTDVFLRNIDGEMIPCYYDSNRDLDISVETLSLAYSEARVNSTEWFSMGKATDGKTGGVMPHTGTVVGMMAHTSDTSSQTIKLYVNNTNKGTIATFPAGSGERSLFDNSLDIRFVPGDKIRLRGGGGAVIQDTIIILRIKWFY